MMIQSIDIAVELSALDKGSQKEITATYNNNDYTVLLKKNQDESLLIEVSSFQTAPENKIIHSGIEVPNIASARFAWDDFLEDIPRLLV